MTAARASWNRAGSRHHLPFAGLRTATRRIAPPRRSPALAAAVETMLRGAAFLYTRAATLDDGGVSSGAHRATVLGNSLRELDRFLIVLLDELAVAVGLSGQALRSFRRRRSATAKLAAYPALFGHRIDDRTRLLALAGQRAALLCRAMKSGDRRDARLITGAAVESAPPVIDLKDVTAYYGRLATRIIRHIERVRTVRPAARQRLTPMVRTSPQAMADG